ncbi:MAG TPA: response regulator transcription factor [Candidatus Cottocaccamicrobium excrementipullorum]|nr:response regulator transcription factor [Candidatus Cottocaccamicrobium excrementipullorum]
MEGEQIRILAADDDPEILKILVRLLESQGYQVTTAVNGQEAAELASEEIDLYILDVNMPIVSGFAAAARIRERFLAPIIFLTAYSGDGDRQMGFLAGADDYVVKPFSNQELLLRIKSLLRRVRQYGQEAGKKQEKSSRLCCQDLILDLDAQQAILGDRSVALTHTEFRILELFLSHPGKIFSLENIYQSIWEEEAVGDGTIMAHIKNIRKKLGDSPRNPRYIKTAWGKGYYVD